LARRRSDRSVKKTEKVERQLVSETGFNIIGSDIRILDAGDLIIGFCFAFDYQGVCRIHPKISRRKRGQVLFFTLPYDGIDSI
jgi:hypothetical protein